MLSVKRKKSGEAMLARLGLCCWENGGVVGFVVVVDGDGCLSAGGCGEDGVAVVVGWFEVKNNDR